MSNVVPLRPSARREAAALVRRARAAAGLTQEQAARASGLSERAYRDIELGRVRMAALEALIELGRRAAPSGLRPGSIEAHRSPQATGEPLADRLSGRTNSERHEDPRSESLPPSGRRAA